MGASEKLDGMISHKLDQQLDCEELAFVCDELTSRSGREKIHQKVRDMIINGGVRDIDACLVQIENEFEMNKEEENG